MEISCCSSAIPLVGALVLALCGRRNCAPEINVAFSLGTFFVAPAR